MTNKNGSTSDFDFKYRCVADMRDLDSGHWKNIVIVGDGPDARTANLLYRARVAENRPSQKGLKFDNGSILRKNNFGKTRFCFLSNPQVDELFWRQKEFRRFCNCVNAATPEDVTALNVLVRTDVGMTERSCHVNWHQSYRRELVERAACFDFIRLRTFTDLIGPKVTIKTAA